MRTREYKRSVKNGANSNCMKTCVPTPNKASEFQGNAYKHEASQSQIGRHCEEWHHGWMRQHWICKGCFW